MSSAVDLKSKEEKDAELDKRIEALRKKNEALMKRYQEIEEDRKKAEQEGIAVTTPKKIKKPEDEPSKRQEEKDNFSITIGLKSAEKRIVRDRRSPNHSSDAPCSPDKIFPRSPPHRPPGGTGRSTCLERSDVPSRESSGVLGGGFRGERGHRSRGGRSRGSARERIGGGERRDRLREWEERVEGGKVSGERKEKVGRFSGRPNSDKEEQGGRLSEREECGGGDEKQVGNFIEQVKHDGAKEEQDGRSSRWEQRKGRERHRVGKTSDKEEIGGYVIDHGASLCEREDYGAGDREGRRSGGVWKLQRGGQMGSANGGSGVKECGGGSDEWKCDGGQNDEWGIGGSGGEERVARNESGGCSGRVRGGALVGKGDILKAKKASGVTFSEHRQGHSAGSSSEGGGVGGPERKVKDWEEKRRQNIEKMNEEMEKIAEYERSEREGVREKNPFRNFLDDPRRCGPIMEIDRKEGSRRHVRNWGGSDFERLKTGIEREKVPRGRRQSPSDADDMTLSMTGRERAEYMRWKTEREQIDQERLARHRKPTGQWRREWDAEKNESMFKEGSAPIITNEEGNRFDENKRPPKAPTFGDFFAQGEAPNSGQKKKARPRERGPPKAYSMHDNRWEENAAQLEVAAVEEKECNVEKQEEIESTTVPDNSEAEDVEDDDQWEDASEDEEEIFGGEYEEEIVEEVEEVTGLVNEEKEKEAVVELVMEREQKQQEKKTIKEGDAKTVVFKREDANIEAQSLPSDLTKNKRITAPKLTIDIPSEAIVEKSLESKPLSPFSPEGGHNPVLDWGAEMDNELWSHQSSSEDSPPQADKQTAHCVGNDGSESEKMNLVGNFSDVIEAAGVDSPIIVTRFVNSQDMREDPEEARCFSHSQETTQYANNEL